MGNQKPKPFVNFSDYMNKNQSQVDAMGAKLDAQQQNIGGYANQARSELKQSTQKAANSGQLQDGDYTKLPEWKHYTDSTKAYQDYQLGQRTQGGRQLELQNEYNSQGGATKADAALLYRRASKNAPGQQAMQGWNNYLEGLEQVSGEGQANYTRGEKAKTDAMRNQEALNASQQAEKAAEAARKKAYYDEQAANSNPSGNPQQTYGGPGADMNTIGTNNVNQAAYQAANKAKAPPAPQEPTNDGYEGASYDPNNPAPREEQERAFYQAREDRWKKYQADLAAWQSKYGGK